MKTILHFKTLVFKKTISKKLKLPDKNYRTSIISLAILCLLMIVPLHINAQELSTYPYQRDRISIQDNQDQAILIKEQRNLEFAEYAAKDHVKGQYISNTNNQAARVLAPVNDLCADAINMNYGDTESGSTLDATFDNVGFCGTSNTTSGVWYTFTGNGGLARLSTCNQANYDTKISVFTGSCGALICEAGLDDSFAAGCGLTTQLDFPTTSGTLYYVLVHGFGSGVGDFDLSLSCISSPVINCPADIVQDNDPGQCGAIVTFDEPTATDNCSGSSQQVITTTFEGGNGQSGNMFDVTAINDLTIDSFDINIDASQPENVEIYFKTGSYVGFETNAAAWTLVGSTTVTSAGENLPTPLDLSLGINVTAGQSIGLYITLSTSTNINYTNGSNTYTDANMQITTGVGNVYQFGGTFTPRTWNGNIIYSVGAPPLVSQTSGLPSGSEFPVGTTTNTFEATDGSGNTATCSFDVTIEDNEAPIASCLDITVELGENGMVSIVPEDLTSLSGVDNLSASNWLGYINVPNYGFGFVAASLADIKSTVDAGSDAITLQPNFIDLGLSDAIVQGSTYIETVGTLTGTAFEFSGSVVSDDLDPEYEAYAFIRFFNEDFTAFFGEITAPLVAGNDFSVVHDGSIPGAIVQFGFTVEGITGFGSDESSLGSAVVQGMALNTAFDNCGIASTTTSQTEFGCDDLGDNTVTLTVTDTAGLVSTCDATVTVVDNRPQGNYDGDALGDLCDEDDDNDGILDVDDNCQFGFNPDQANYDGDAEGDICDADDDNDGCPDTQDPHPFSMQGSTVIIGGCDTGVANQSLGCSTMADILMDCCLNSNSQFSYIRCVNQTLSAWVRSRIITRSEQRAISQCASRNYANCSNSNVARSINSTTNSGNAMIDFDVKTWPNPTSNDFNLRVATDNKLDKVDVQVMDITGKRVHSNTFDSALSYKFGESLQAGVYFVRISQGEYNKTSRVIKQ